MALRADTRDLSCIEVICTNDDAVDKEKSDLDAYKKSYDRKHLAFLPDHQPTVFVCNFSLSGKESIRVKNAMVGQSDDGGVSVALGSWEHHVTKTTLKEIRNPADMPLEHQFVLRKDDKGYVHDDLIARLDRVGVVGQIFAAYSTLVMSEARQNAKN